MQVMDFLTTPGWISCAIALVFGAVAGFLLGGRKAKRAKRDMQHTLNLQSVELLEARTETRKLSQYLGAAKRKDRVLELALTKLKTGTENETALKLKLEDIDRQHFIEMQKMNMTMVESKQRAKVAAVAAREAGFRLRLLEKALPQMQTISAPEPKSYGHGEAVTVSVVDKHAPAAKREQANVVSNRDLHRLTALKSSNEQVCERPVNTVKFPPSPAPTPVPNDTHRNHVDEHTDDEQILPKNSAAKRAP